MLVTVQLTAILGNSSKKYWPKPFGAVDRVVRGIASGGKTPQLVCGRGEGHAVDSHGVAAATDALDLDRFGWGSSARSPSPPLRSPLSSSSNLK